MTIRTIPRLLAPLAAALLAIALLGACGSSNNDKSSSSTSSSSGSGSSATSAALIQKNAANAKTTLTIGSKNFTEQKVLGEIYAQALGAAGYKVRRQLNLGDQDIALKALKSGQISGYPEYTGTALLAFLNVAAGKLPHDPQQAYQQVKDGLAKQGIDALPPTPFTSSNEVGVTKQTADKLALKNISDLSSKAKTLTLYGSPECRTRADCLLGLQQVYGLKFKKFVPVNIDQRHEVLKSGQADVSIVFTTDPQIKRNGEVLLQDDKGMFPPYNSTLIMKDATAQKAGADLAKTIDALQKPLTDDAMQELDARVDLDKKDPSEVAKEYLSETGLVK